MPDHLPEDVNPAEAFEALRRQTEALQSELDAMRDHSRRTAMLADLKVAAVRAGMIDLDGIRLLDLSAVPVTPDGAVPAADGVIAELKRNKPWLFGSWSTSSAKEPPPAQPPRQKQAMDMTDEEYHAARALLLGRRP